MLKEPSTSSMILNLIKIGAKEDITRVKTITGVIYQAIRQVRIESKHKSARQKPLMS